MAYIFRSSINYFFTAGLTNGMIDINYVYLSLSPYFCAEAPPGQAPNLPTAYIHVLALFCQ